jgi:hypothetical protein
MYCFKVLMAFVFLLLSEFGLSLSTGGTIQSYEGGRAFQVFVLLLYMCDRSLEKCRR